MLVSNISRNKFSFCLGYLIAWAYWKLKAGNAKIIEFDIFLFSETAHGLFDLFQLRFPQEIE